MSITLTGAITGGAQTGFTTPSYTASADVAPDVNGKQAAVTALGGTQTGVRTHAVSDPFTGLFYRPKSPKALPAINPVTGKYAIVPKNSYGFIFRKGVNIAASQAPQVAICRVTFDIPAGADAYDSANIRALVSFVVGELNTNSAGLGDTLTTGIM